MILAEERHLDLQLHQNQMIIFQYIFMKELYKYKLVNP